MKIEIKKYSDEFERGWLHCRVLSFLNTQYFNDVYQKKERYDNEAIELIAVEDGQVIGLIDIEIENNAGEICSSKELKSAMLWHIAVHPDHQRKGVGELLLTHAMNELKEKNVVRIEAWTKEDEFVRKWYFKNGFAIFNSYYHVVLKDNALSYNEEIKDLRILSAFSHYTGKDLDSIRDIAEKIEECVGLEKVINE